MCLLLLCVILKTKKTAYIYCNTKTKYFIRVRVRATGNSRAAEQGGKFKNSSVCIILSAFNLIIFLFRALTNQLPVATTGGRLNTQQQYLKNQCAPWTVTDFLIITCNNLWESYKNVLIYHHHHSCCCFCCCSPRIEYVSRVCKSGRGYIFLAKDGGVYVDYYYCLLL